MLMLIGFAAAEKWFFQEVIEMENPAMRTAWTGGLGKLMNNDTQVSLYQDMPSLNCLCFAVYLLCLSAGVGVHGTQLQRHGMPIAAGGPCVLRLQRGDAPIRVLGT
jgi:hypothetical protein